MNKQKAISLLYRWQEKDRLVHNHKCLIKISIIKMICDKMHPKQDYYCKFELPLRYVDTKVLDDPHKTLQFYAHLCE